MTAMGLGLPMMALLLAGLVIADFFVPMVPSAITIATLACFLIGDTLLIVSLIAWAAFLSWLGDVLGYRALRHTRGRVRRSFVGSARIARMECELSAALRRRPRWTTIVARFLPAGRTALAWAAVATPGYPHSRMALVAGTAWAGYMVGVGVLIAWIFGGGLLSAATTITSVAALGIVVGWCCKRARTVPEGADGAGRVRERV